MGLEQTDTLSHVREGKCLCIHLEQTDTLLKVSKGKQTGIVKDLTSVMCMKANI
jgi:hypothetical protein